MINGIAEIKEIKDISAFLSTENKKYVIAVANALLFSQSNTEQPSKPPQQRPYSCPQPDAGSKV